MNTSKGINSLNITFPHCQVEYHFLKFKTIAPCPALWDNSFDILLCCILWSFQIFEKYLYLSFVVVVFLKSNSSSSFFQGLIFSFLIIIAVFLCSKIIFLGSSVSFFNHATRIKEHISNEICPRQKNMDILFFLLFYLFLVAFNPSLRYSSTLSIILAS